MSKYFNILFCLLLVTSCSGNKKEKTLYEERKSEMFSWLISQLEYEPTNIDTLYTEMYIALKVCEEDIEAYKIVEDRVNLLLEYDTIKENQRHYLEALSIVYSMKKDFEKFESTTLRMYDTYPAESFQRMSSYAMFYLQFTENVDSANYYYNKAMLVGENILKSENSKLRGETCLAISSMMIANNKKNEAKEFLKMQLEKETDGDNIQLLSEVINAFDAYAKEVLNSTK